MKKQIPGIVVVEGKSDTQNLKRYYDVQTFETRGLGVNTGMLGVLQELSKRQPIIIFTDPDGPGERIRQKVMAVIPHALHVMLRKNEAMSPNHRKIGVEHASFHALEQAFSHIHKFERFNSTEFPPYEQCDMVLYGFIAQSDAKKRRDYVAGKLHLGTVNAKQFLKRLNLFMISRSELEGILKYYEAGKGAEHHA